MSTFGGLILTNRGRNLQSKAQAGTQINYTRIALGDGNLGSSSILDLNALRNQKKSLPITKLRVLSGGRAVVGTILSNQELTEGFYFREIGVFAMDPDIGEVLYCYANAGALAEYIPPGGGSDVIEKSIDVQTLVGNAQNVTAVIDGSLVYVTREELDYEIENIQVPVKSVNNKTGDITLNAADVGAVSVQTFNEHQADYEQQLGTAELLTTDKTLKGSLNELFTNANNLKVDWAEVVGSPLLATDTSAQLKSKTQDIKNVIAPILGSTVTTATLNTMATNLNTRRNSIATAVNNKGVAATSADNLAQLAIKIGQIPTGKRFATGYVFNNSPGDIKTIALPFNTKFIYIWFPTWNGYSGEATGVISSNSGNSRSTGLNISITLFTKTQVQYQFNVSVSGATVEWLAIEE